MRVIVEKGAFAPVRAHKADAGLDILSPKSVIVPAGGSAVIDTQVHVEIPEGYAGVLMSKSGLNVKHDITSEGVIDFGYTGSIVVKLYNHGETDYQVVARDKISQMLLIPVLCDGVELVDSFGSDTERGNNGFGSTGR